MMTIEAFYNENQGVIELGAILLSVVIGYFSVLQPIMSYVKVQQKLNRDKRFEAYHKLIDDLGGGDERKPMIARQIAILFELRRFAEYFPVTIRILEGIKPICEAGKYHTLVDEINLTLEYIDAHRAKRFFSCRKKVASHIDRLSTVTP